MNNTKTISCTILILTYKGESHLELLLPTVKEVIRNSPEYEIDVLIIDNGKHEPTKEFATHNFPEFQFEFSKKNDYLFSLNPYMKNVKGEYTLLLNDDIRLDKNILNNALPALIKDTSLFASHCNVYEWDESESAEGTRKLFYNRGWLYSQWHKKDVNDTIRYTLYAGGGTSIFRTATFNELGGFDTLFRPAYCEDLDLGHRAWHAGYKIIRQPDSILYHREGATISDQFDNSELSIKVYKNQILWMLKNGNHKGFLFWFLLLLPYRLLLGWKVDQTSYIALWRAFPQIPKALLHRIKTKKRVKDEEIMKKLNTVYEIPKKL